MVVQLLQRKAEVAYITVKGIQLFPN
jgi:hypothetical protein